MESVIVYGNIVDGFGVCGPFESTEDAVSYGNDGLVRSDRDNWSVLCMIDPETTTD